MSTVTDYVRLGALHVPQRIALVHEESGRRLTYRELDRDTGRLALGLAQLGLRSGDRLACLLHTSLEYVLLYLAAIRAGVVVVPVNVLLLPEEIRYIVEDAGVSAIAVDEITHAPAVAAGAAGRLPTVLVGGELGSHVDVVDYQQLASARGDAPQVAISDRDLLALGFTSGTTGFPKAAELTHGGVAAMNRTNALAYRLPMASRGAYSGNMSFTATVPAFILTHLSLAGTLVLARSNEPGSVLRTIMEFGCNFSSVPPPLVGQWAEAVEQNPAALAGLGSVLQGAGPANLEDVARLSRALGGRLLTGWGMTEASGGLVTALSAQDSRSALTDPQLLASVGHSLPGFEVRVDNAGSGDEDGGATGIGELVVRSSSMVRAYWRRPEASALAMADGWYRTGDLGRFDEEGRIVLVDRRSDLIVSGGINVYPGEVERVLQLMPGVSECAVIGVPHSRWGRAVGAVVVTADPAMTEADVITWCRAHLATYKKPTTVVFRRELPRTVSGKLRRYELEQLVTAELGITRE